jgi:hypothetical protein
MKKILIVVIVGILGYGGWLFAKPYMQNHFLQRQMQGLAHKAHLKNDREIIQELVAFANERDLPLGRRNFEVQRYDGRTIITVKYEQVVETPVLSKAYRFNTSVRS